ncbi:MAG TPA: trehalose-phosphatase [Solirubrobacteraceae bacterium]|nr:trehalose-phosphatase [Solirubrobacteraceae bacterium]
MTSGLITEALQPLRADRRHAAVLFDIDGTLAPIVDRASDAHVPESTRQLLIALAEAYGLVACVSGRRASEARAMVSIGTIAYLGSHGIEELRPGWTTARLDPAITSWVRQMHEFGAQHDTAQTRKLRVRLEDKGAIVAFHWRGAPDEDAARHAVERIADAATDAGLVTHWGRKVLEVRPPVPFDKGAGVRRLLEEAGDSITVALYAGDDRTDLDAFRALGELAEEDRLRHVVRVGVASEEGPAEIREQADVLVDGPPGVRQLLTLLTSGEDPA